MDQMDLVLELEMGHLPNKCKDSGHWTLYHQCECKLGERIRLRGSGGNHPHTLLALEELREQHREEELVLELQERHQYRHTDKLCWLQSRQRNCTLPLEVLGLGLALDLKAMEPELAGMAVHVLQARLSSLPKKYLPMQGSLVQGKCGKQPQGQAPAL